MSRKPRGYVTFVILLGTATLAGMMIAGIVTGYFG